MGTNKTRWRGKERKDRRQQKTPHSGYRFAWRVSWCGKWRCGRGNMRASVMYHCEWAIWRETRRTWRPWGIYVCIYKPVHIDYKKQRELDSEKRKKKKDCGGGVKRKDLEHLPKNPLCIPWTLGLFKIIVTSSYAIVYICTYTYINLPVSFRSFILCKRIGTWEYMCVDLRCTIFMWRREGKKKRKIEVRCEKGGDGCWRRAWTRFGTTDILSHNVRRKAIEGFASYRDFGVQYIVFCVYLYPFLEHFSFAKQSNDFER